jgi:peptidoglycan/xylan/chitin deacetylase (PgdA/CDA1 family)
MPAPAIPILLYHSITADAGDAYRRFAMDPGQFAEQMQLIAAGGFDTMTVSELVAAFAGPASALPPRPLVLTFDDGFAEMESVALPILTRLRLRATEYVVTGHVGGRSTWLASIGEGDRPLLSAGQIRELDSAGVEIGSHGHRHRALDEMRFPEAAADITESRRVLEGILGHGVGSFAYPFGYHTARIARHVRASGFTSACGVKQALSHPGDDVFALGRAIVGSDLPCEQLERWIRGEGLPMSWRGERVRTRVWRAARRMKSGLRRSTAAEVEVDA